MDNKAPIVGDDGLLLASPELEMLRQNKLDGYNYRYRKVADWDENYELYRDKVIINRLTQRQSVNLPIMKSQIRTLLKDVDDMPVIYFENLDNDKQKEIFKNDYWKDTVDKNHMDLQDIVDKRQVFLFGRSYDQWQIADGRVKMTVQDPYDILVQRYVDPFDINTSRYLIHLHIFKPLAQLADDPDYDSTAVEEMKNWYATRLGLVKASENQRLLVQKNQRMSDMGVPDVQSPVLGETYVELALHFIYRPKGEKWTDKSGVEHTTDAEQIFLYVECDNMRILLKKPLEEIIGTTVDHFWRDHYPYVSWADDLERQDWYSDGVADIIRTPNKVMNTWFSQMVENRSLKNLNMHIFNSNIEGFQPQTWQPMAFGMYGVPLPANAALADVFQPIPVDDLKDSLEEMNFLQGMIEKASGATPTQQGVANEKEITLGEVKLQLSQAQQRIRGMSKFYTPAWKQRALIFLKLCEAAPDKLDAIKIYKKGRNSNDVYAREITPEDWRAKTGYGIKIWSQDEKDSMDLDSLNKLSAVKQNMPDNPKLQEIYDRKLLEFAGLKPEEINDVMTIEQEKIKAAAEGQGKPEVPQESMQLPYQYVPDDIKRQMEEAFGFKPSQMGGMGVPPTPGDPNAPQPGQPGQPTPPTPAPAAPMPMIPANNPAPGGVQ